MRELLKEEGQLEYRVAFDYIYQIGLALKYLHNKGDNNLQHRDVQPKNMVEQLMLIPMEA